jgi:hypothetical protein
VPDAPAGPAEVLAGLVNLRDYTPLQLSLNAAGCLLWVVVYYVIVRDIVRKRFVEMPFFIACGNLAWEFVWSVPFSPDTGHLFAWLYRSAFFLDLFIFANLLRYGQKQVGTPELVRHWRPLCLALVAAWVPLCYFFRSSGPDDAIGATSGYILNLFISVLYFQLYFRVRDRQYFSLPVAWTRMLGTALITVSVWLIFPENRFVQTLGLFCFVLDSLFIALLRAERGLPAPLAGGGAADGAQAAVSGTRSTSRVMSS